MNNCGITVAEFIKEFRQLVGDTTCDAPDTSLITYINTALRRLARSRGLDRLFTYQDSFELASLNSDGSSAASWTLKGIPAEEGEEAPRLGQIIDIISLLILDSSDCEMSGDGPCYMPFLWFRREHPFPENKEPGTPCWFTINQVGCDTRITFDRPIAHPFAIDLVYTAFPPKVTSLTDLIRVPYGFQDILMTAVQILYQMEAADFASAFALTQEWDYFVAEARELLAKRPTTLGLRKIRSSF